MHYKAVLEHAVLDNFLQRVVLTAWSQYPLVHSDQL